MTPSNLDALAKLEIAVVGVTRNGARFLSQEIARLRKATSAFGAVHALVIESDSSDSTLTVLHEAARAWPALRYKSLGQLRESLPQRTVRIAHCRNAYLDELASNPVYAGVSHVIVADLDRVCTDITAQALASCWAAPEAWDACTSNQGDHYYDIWALRHEVWCPGDAWHDHARLLPVLGEPEATNVALFSRMVHIPADRPMIEVQSAFGGLAVYRREALLNARYIGADADGTELCEHVPLHAAIRRAGGRIFINPALINARNTKHGGRKGFWRTQRRHLWAWLKSFA